MNISSVFSNINSEAVFNECVMSGLAFFSGLAVAQGFDDSKYFNHNGNVSYKLRVGSVAVLSLGAVGAWLGIAASLRENADFLNIALKAALVTAPVLFSLLKRTQVLIYSSVTPIDGRSTVFINGDIKDSNGQTIAPSYTNYRMQFIGNQPFGVTQTDIPEYLLNKTPPESPLRVFYKGFPIEVIPKNFKCTKMTYHNALDEWDPAGLLRLADGSKIARKPNERLVKLEFSENTIQKTGYLPESFARNLTPGQPLELKYRGIPILITMADKCFNELSPKEEVYDSYNENLETQIRKILNGSLSTEAKDAQILELLKSSKK